MTPTRPNAYQIESHATPDHLKGEQVMSAHPMVKCKECGGKLDQRIRVTCPDLCGKCWLKRMSE